MCDFIPENVENAELNVLYSYESYVSSFDRIIRVGLETLNNIFITGQRICCI